MTTSPRQWRRILSITAGLSLLLPVTAMGAETSGSPEPTLESRETGAKKEGGDISREIRRSPFSWDEPGPSSPVLHWGASGAAGMKEEPLKAIDPFIRESIVNKMMPGAVVLIARRGTVVKHAAYGDALRYADDRYTPVESPISMKKDTIFDIASISKIFTTVAAMKLYEQGKFQLDDPVAKYIPEFAANGKERVTIRQLMTHTSGFEPWIPLYTMGDNREERLNIVLEHPLKNEPGTTYAYSDLNLITLGVLVERLSGMRLDRFVQKHITEPLGMEDTMYNPPESLKERIAATECQPWTGRDLVWGQVHDENAWSLDGVAGHAGVFSTARDLAVFAHMILQKGKYGNTRILRPETVERMEENQNSAFPGEDHGLGWELNQGWYMDALADIHSMGHTGYTGTSMVINRDNNAIAILLTNRVHPTRQTVSTNPVRRQVARLAADAIPVAGLGREGAWFSGYGDNLERSLTSRLPEEAGQPLIFTFDTWYRTEAEPGSDGEDFGVVEVSSDGETWTRLSDPLIGDSGGWKRWTLSVPEGTKVLRFRYHTDGYANGRGWYVKDPQLTTAEGKRLSLDWSGEGWEIRTW